MNLTAATLQLGALLHAGTQEFLMAASKVQSVDHDTEADFLASWRDAMHSDIFAVMVTAILSYKPIPSKGWRCSHQTGRGQRGVWCCGKTC